MLETIREFAAEQLAEREGADAVWRRHLGHFAELARDVQERAKTGDYDLDRIEEERDNLRLAFETALTEDPAAAVELSGNLRVYWARRGQYREGRQALAAGLSGAPDAPTEARACALAASGFLASKQADLDAADRFTEDALELYRELGDARGAGSSLNLLGINAWYRGELGTAMRLLEDAIAEYRGTGHERGARGVLMNLGGVANASGDHRRAIEIARELIAGSSEHHGRAIALINLGLPLEAAGETEEARRAFAESITLSRTHGLTEVLAYGLASLAHLERRSEPAEALAHYRESLALLHDMDDQRGIAYCLEGLAAVDVAGQDARRATTLLGAAATIRHRTGAALDVTEQTELDDAVAQVRRLLGDEAFDVGWAEGTRLSAGEAAEIALGREDPIDLPSGSTGQPGP